DVEVVRIYYPGSTPGSMCRIRGPCGKDAAVAIRPRASLDDDCISGFLCSFTLRPSSTMMDSQKTLPAGAELVLPFVRLHERNGFCSKGLGHGVLVRVCPEHVKGLAPGCDREFVPYHPGVERGEVLAVEGKCELGVIDLNAAQGFRAGSITILSCRQHIKDA